jgi:hypothetical protein
MISSFCSEGKRTYHISDKGEVMNITMVLFSISLFGFWQQASGAAGLAQIKQDIDTVARQCKGSLGSTIQSSSHSIKVSCAIDGQRKLHVTVTVSDSTGRTEYATKDFIAAMGPFFKGLIQKTEKSFGDILVAESSGLNGLMEFTGYQELGAFMTNLHQDCAGIFMIDPPLFDGAVTSFRIVREQSAEYTMGPLTHVAEVIFRDGTLDWKDTCFGQLQYSGPCISLTDACESVSVPNKVFMNVLIGVWFVAVIYIFVGCQTPFCI